MKATKRLVPRDERVTINHEFDSVERFIAEYVTNISRSGVFIRTRDPLPIGTKVNLRFSVIMDELETIEGIGEVVRVQHEPPGMGVVFIELTSHSQDLIAKLITKRRVGERPRKGPPPVPGKPVSDSTPRPAEADKAKPVVPRPASPKGTRKS